MIEEDKKGLENQENMTENTVQDSNIVEKLEINTVIDEVETAQSEIIEENKTESQKDEADNISEDKKIENDEIFVSEIDVEEEEKLEDTQDKPEENDYASLNNEEIIEKLKHLIYESNIEETRKDIDLLKSLFYKNLKKKQDALRQEIINSTGNELEVSLPKDANEDYLKELWIEYAKKREELAKQQEVEKLENLKRKEEIIEKIKVLANGEESMNKTFNEFKDLQQEWLKIGQVPAEVSNNLWNNYQLQIERFYDLVKLNKEARDFDFKRNLEQKIELCEKAEELLLVTDVVAAYKKLQDYHELWKELGPVPSDKRVELWDRFSDISKKVRKNYQDYFEKLKEEREANYKQKLILCEKVENILTENTPNSGKEWIELSEQVLEIQKVWKTIGMVPAAVNNEVFERFRMACNKFFEGKNDFFNEINAEQKDNLQKKIEICLSAESLQESTDWKKSTGLFIDLQKKWKEIGPVPRKSSDQVWKRFRQACDHFFNAKSEFFENIVKEHKDNLIKKEALIEEIKNYKPLGDQTENINKIKEFQNTWTEIGFVANSERDKLYNEYREAINELYKKLKLNKSALELSNFANKVDAIKESGSTNELAKERNRILQKIKELNAEILKIENNMGFFASGSESLVKDFNKKIEKAQAEIKTLKEKKKAIDLAERELKKKDKNDEQTN